LVKCDKSFDRGAAGGFAVLKATAENFEAAGRRHHAAGFSDICDMDEFAMLESHRIRSLGFAGSVYFVPNRK
jgi:hypothetical protein